MNSDAKPQPAALKILAAMQSQALERFELELGDLRTTMMAMATCCEQSLARIRDARWVSFDSASQVITELSERAEAERARAEQLSEELQIARRELDDVREECHAEIEAAREAALRYRDETAASCLRELNAARELAASAMEAENRVREELTAMQARNQEIVDSQMLRLVELKRELEKASAEADAARAAAEAANREAFAKLGQRGRAGESETQPRAAEPSARPVDRNRHQVTPEFDAIEAALADSPPVPAWERIA